MTFQMKGTGGRNGLEARFDDQLRGEAGRRQVANARLGLAHVLGFGLGVGAAGVHILEKV